MQVDFLFIEIHVSNNFVWWILKFKTLIFTVFAKKWPADELDEALRIHKMFILHYAYIEMRSNREQRTQLYIFLSFLPLDSYHFSFQFWR